MTLEKFRVQIPTLALKPETPEQRARRADSIRAIGIDKLNVKPGDVILITSEAFDHDMIVGSLRQLLGDAYVYICLKPGQTLEALDEGMMNLAGWKRQKKRGRIHRVNE